MSCLNVVSDIVFWESATKNLFGPILINIDQDITKGPVNNISNPCHALPSSWSSRSDNVIIAIITGRLLAPVEGKVFGTSQCYALGVCVRPKNRALKELKLIKSRNPHIWTLKIQILHFIEEEKKWKIFAYDKFSSSGAS